MTRRIGWHLKATACLLLLALSAPALHAADAKPLAFRLTFDKAVSAEPFTGRVYVLLSRNQLREPLHSPSWFGTEPFFAKDVKGWKPGEPLAFGGDALGFPAPLPKLKPGKYWVMAVMDFDRGDISFGRAEGNGFSKAVLLDLDPANGGPVNLAIDQVVKLRQPKETDRVKFIELESKLLSQFHGRPVKLRAGVALPKSFAADPAKRYPVVYEIPGFGGTHTGAFGAAGRNLTDVAGVEMLWVVLDPSCRLGHHVFADSENNGPVGKALVEELLPHIEAKFRGIGKPGARFVTGHSSGGWSSLWLQVTYPDFFGGTWSTSPDPVDFRDFQRINLYQPAANMFIDAAGQRRPIARMGGKPALYYKPFSDMEVVMGRGGQLFSFEAVFSPRGPDGKPLPLWDKQTGAVDPAVAKSWERYDIRLVLERSWMALAPRLQGKIHVYMGDMDTFYLEGATRLLKESLARLGSDAVVELFPGRDHGLVDRPLRQRIAKEMAETFHKNN